MWSAVWTGLKMIASPVTEVVKGWQKRKSAKQQNELAIAQAKTNALIKRLETGQKADIAWEQTSITNSGWKDEYWTVILSIPAILCFVPGMSQYVTAGFESLKQTPDWYQWAFGIAVASSFGYRKLADFMALKKGD